MNSLDSVVVVRRYEGYVAYVRFDDAADDCDLSSTNRDLLQRMITERIRDVIGNKAYYIMMDAFNATWNRTHVVNRPRIV